MGTRDNIIAPSDGRVSTQSARGMSLNHADKLVRALCRDLIDARKARDDLSSSLRDLRISQALADRITR
jgi:hypothetical protein